MPLDDNMIEDDEGNKYTKEQVRAAVEQMTKDESGGGSLGGLAEGNDGGMAATQDPNADVDRAVAEVKGKGQSRGRELNPANFGDFVSDNVFGGFNGKYITGKRPMTLFDFATDALGQYSGVDIGARNAQIRKNSRENDLAGIQAEKAGQDIKSGRARQSKDEATTQKLGMETHKLTTEAIGNIFNDVDSDLWETRMGELEKEHGITIPKSTKAMMTRWMEKARDIGVTNPQEVLDNPDQYDEGFVNRTKHTFGLVSKNVTESQSKEAELEGKKSATGIAQAKAGREEDVANAQQLGVEQAIDLLRNDIQSGDPAKVQAARGKMAAILEGGTSRQKVLNEMAGVKTAEGTGRNLAERGYIDRARESLPPGASPGQVATKVAELKRTDAAQKTGATKSAGLVEEAKVNVARGRSLLNTMRGAVKSYGLASGALEANTVQPLRMILNSVMKDPKYAVLNAFPATMSNIARAMGEKGVLTDQDVLRISQAVNPNTTDTEATYNARLDFVEQAMQRGQQEVEAAANEGRAPAPVDLTDLTFDGDPLGGQGAQPAQPGTSQAGNPQAAAAAALKKAETITDPAERKTFLAAELKRIKGGQ